MSSSQQEASCGLGGIFQSWLVSGTWPAAPHLLVCSSLHSLPGCCQPTGHLLHSRPPPGHGQIYACGSVDELCGSSSDASQEVVFCWSICLSGWPEMQTALDKRFCLMDSKYLVSRFRYQFLRLCQYDLVPWNSELLSVQSLWAGKMNIFLTLVRLWKFIQLGSRQLLHYFFFPELGGLATWLEFWTWPWSGHVESLCHQQH